jgi:hypothetical protein
MSTDLQRYQEILAEQLEPKEIIALKQPERHVLVSYKVFKYLVARIEQLEAIPPRKRKE